MSLNNDPNILFNIQNNGGGDHPQIPVDVLWGGFSIASITGPAPFIDIGSEMNRSENGKPQSVIRNITLTGKIARIPAPTGGDGCYDRKLSPNNLGISGIIGAVDELQRLFEKCPTSDLRVVCKSPADSNLYAITGVKFQSLNIEKGNDNWTKTADFTISLQHEKSLSDDPADQVTDKVDTWSIEPLEDTIYTDFKTNISARPEWSNPNVKDPAQGNSSATKLRVLSVPQFRIIRRLSAKGIPIQSGSGSGTGCDPSGTGIGNFYQPSFLSAKLWVDKQTKLAFAGSGSGGEPYFTNTPNLSEFKDTWLYNYTRSVNIDVNNATYEATDTWLAMPTGMPYTETYTIESSTNLEMIKTVRINGNVQGLSFTPFNVMDGSSGIFPTGSGKDNPINLSFSLTQSSGGKLNPVHQIPDVASDLPSSITSLAPSKYANAVSGWLYDIKPYLYRRACLVMDGPDRPKPYMPAHSVTPPKPPENPIYSKESLLSVIPVSTSEGHDPKKGTISYNYEYNNKFNIISGTISENITISNEGPSDVVAETQIPGRALGPIMQKTGSTASKKTLNIEITVMAPTGVDGFFIQNPACPVFTGGYIYGIINRLVEGVKPFGNTGGRTDLFGPYAYKKNITGQVFVTSDQDSWTPTQGRYTRTVSWTYQQCSNARFYLDH